MGRDRDASRRRRQETPNKIEDQGSSPCREVPQRLSIIEGNEATVPKKRTYDSISPAGTTESQVPPSTGTAVKKHKKMKRKKNKAKRSNAILNNDCSNFDESVSSDNIPLEGSMVGSHMTLLDRSMGIVYSALERQDDSARKQIGTIDHNGSIKLASRESSADDGNKSVHADDTEEKQSDFPFDTEPDDHCESPLQAYQDVVPFLKSFGQKSPTDLKIYDPYYCNGAVRRNLEKLGFPNVYNRKEDCYKVWADPRWYPSYDVFITNPPYSEDHMEKLIKHVTAPAFGNRPWMLLMPQFVHKKDYYLRSTSHIQPFYLVPKKRYVYLPPPSFRQAKKSDVHKKSSPFVSMWYIWGGAHSQNNRWLAVARKSCYATCDVARSKSALRDLRRKR